MLLPSSIQPISLLISSGLDCSLVGLKDDLLPQPQSIRAGPVLPPNGALVLADQQGLGWQHFPITEVDDVSPREAAPLWFAHKDPLLRVHLYTELPGKECIFSCSHHQDQASSGLLGHAGAWQGKGGHPGAVCIDTLRQGVFVVPEVQKPLGASKRLEERCWVW